MSDLSDSSVSDGIDWQDVEPDEEQITYVSPFGSETFTSLEALLEHCKTTKNFDLLATAKRLHLDFHGGVKFVNFLRARVRDSEPISAADISARDFEDDKYLMPVLENDALLFNLDELLEQEEDAVVEVPASSDEPLTPEAQNKQLQAELASLQEQFANYRLAVEQTLDRRWGDDADAKPAGSEPKKDNSDYYFESYAANEIHETMLKDQVRTDAYRDFIYENKNLFAGKTVLDIGCGTGILSMFCAKAGAAQVIAVDKSDIIVKAQENIFNNGLADKITCLRGAIEDVKLPVDKVDVIVSEWMGYCLLYEAMLPSVLYARDRYLREGGLMIPSSGTIWMAPIEDSQYIAEHITFWRDVYGFNMKAMQEGIYDDVRVEVMPAAAVCGTASPISVLDLYKVKPEELVFTSQWNSQLTRGVDGLDGFLIWFDNFFSNSTTNYMPADDATPETWKPKNGDIAFTTGPFKKDTHWRQGALLMPSSESGELPAEAKLAGSVTFAAHESNPRALKLTVSWAVDGKEEKKRSWDLK